MDVVTLDFETYYDSEYTLKKIKPLLYIRDDRFLIHGCAVKIYDSPAVWVPRAELCDMFARIDWDNSIVVSHNANFDMAILYEKFGYIPAQYVDTLALCRSLLADDLSFKLEDIVRTLKIGEKGKELVLSKGLRELPPDVEEALAGYAENDADLAHGLYEKLWDFMPVRERWLMHLTVRMSVVGRFLLDAVVAQEAWDEKSKIKNAKIKSAGVDPSVLRSGPKFADLLKSHGITPPKKLNDKGEEINAFSKQDVEFLNLLTNPDIAPIIEARMAAMSNSELTRIQAFQSLASMPPHTIPMPLKLFGAHTGRWSGDGGFNPQNLKHGKLRRSLVAPDGKVVVVVDSKQIELRMNFWFCGEDELVELLGTGRDIYIHTAADNFGVHEDEVNDNQRQFGKVIELAAGYGQGYKSFRRICAIGPMGNPPIYISESEAWETINHYRATHRKVVEMWTYLNNYVIPSMFTGDNEGEMLGPVEIRKGALGLPNGMELLYPNLRATEDGWTYGIGNKRHKIYGGLLLENIIQALARVVVGDQMLDMHIELPELWVASMTHDEVIGHVDEDKADETFNSMIGIMRRVPDWAPGLPLDGSGGWAKEYSK